MAIYPHKVDYCDTCPRIRSKIHEKQTTINRKLQGGNALPKEIKTKCAKQWVRICELEIKSSKTEAKKDELSTLKHCLMLLLSAEYQMLKLLPYWGRSPQPGSTYYLQKLLYDLLEIVDHHDNSDAVYIFNKRVGHQTADHTFSYLLHYLKSTGKSSQLGITCSCVSR